MTTTETPWHAAYPAPRHVHPIAFKPSQVLDMLKNNGSGQGKQFLLVDLRRNDHEGGTIHRSINLPAQSLYPSIPMLYTMLRAARIHTIIWYCGSSRGRGNRAASWFSDYIADQGDSDMQSAILEGGIKAWVAGGEEYVKYMDNYDSAKWSIA